MQPQGQPPAQQQQRWVEVGPCPTPPAARPQPLSPEPLIFVPVGVDFDALPDTLAWPPKYQVSATGYRWRGPAADGRPPALGVRVSAGGRQLAIFKHKGEPIVCDAVCPHSGGQIELGDIEEHNGELCITCPRHGFLFSASTGEGVVPAGAPWRLRVYRTKWGKATTPNVAADCEATGSVDDGDATDDGTDGASSVATVTDTAAAAGVRSRLPDLMSGLHGTFTRTAAAAGAATATAVSLDASSGAATAVSPVAGYAAGYATASDSEEPRTYYRAGSSRDENARFDPCVGRAAVAALSSSSNRSVASSSVFGEEAASRSVAGSSVLGDAAAKPRRAVLLVGMNALDDSVFGDTDF